MDMTKVKRRAPKNGYDHNMKQEYRDNVWSNIFPIISYYLTDDKAKVLLLPSKEGLEIDTAIKYGIKPEQIIAIDENPALIAVSEWRKKYPEVNYFGCKVSKVGEKIKKNGWYLLASNLDFCNNLSDEVINETKAFLKETPLHHNFVFAFTLMKGRESKGITHFMDVLNKDYDINCRRIASYLSVCDFKKTCLKEVSQIVFEGDYFDTSPMTYGVVVLSNYSDEKVFISNFRTVLNSFISRTKEQADVIWGEVETRMKRYLMFINDCHKYSENDFDENTFEEDLSRIYKKHNVPDYIWMDHFGEFYFRSHERRFFLGNLKKWLKGTLSKKEVLDFYYYIDESMDLDTHYVFYGIPQGANGHHWVELDDIISIGTRNYGKDETVVSEKECAESLFWAFMPNSRKTDLSYW